MDIEIALFKFTQVSALTCFALFVLFVYVKTVPTIQPLAVLSDKKQLLNIIIFSFFYLVLFMNLFFLTTVSSGYLLVIGFLLAMFGLVLATWSRLQMRESWAPVHAPTVPRAIVTSGPFRFMRHPVYAGRLAFFTGVFLMTNPVMAFFGFFYWYILSIKARGEEESLKASCDSYKIYLRKMRKVPRLFIFCSHLTR